MRMFPLYALTFLSLTSACGRGPGSSTQKERWDARNDPGLMESMVEQYRYVQEFDQLPLEGTLEKIPWTGDYWPTFKGGITYRWNDEASEELDRYAYDLIPFSQLNESQIPILSAAEKFDLYLGREDYPFTRWERQRTEILKTVERLDEYEKGYTIPTWEGLCHAWAPAALLFDEPNPVVMTGKTGQKIAFGSGDIKALLVYFLHDTKADTNFLGTRCNVDIKDLVKKYRNHEISYRYYQDQLAACSNVNAGAFHVVLANQIGRLKEGFIADVDKGPQVWNHPIFEYQSEIKKVKDGATKGAAPGTVKEIEVMTQMTYIVEYQSSWDRMDDIDASMTRNYHYRLEIDNNGKIIGGAWIGQDHPDFLWKQSKPAFEGLYKAVEEIYEASLRGAES
ncbi:MAG: hypothetical protein HYW48_03940 [Deltaproteobacteria bacterium]|nr:hypothetical protein [Deltaproteobacteria bacterium]